MDKIGLTFRSYLTPDEVTERYIRPLRDSLQDDSLGIYSNYLRQVDPEAVEPTEHLIIFEVTDFKLGLRCLRLTSEKLGLPENFAFQNLNPSDPGY